MARTARRYLRRTHVRSMHSTIGTEVVPICTEWWSRRLTLFGHIMRMDDNADTKKILLASPPADWRRQLCRPRITWLSTVQQDLKQHHLTLPEAADLAPNSPQWGWCRRMAIRNLRVAYRKRWRRQCILWVKKFNPPEVSEIFFSAAENF